MNPKTSQITDPMELLQRIGHLQTRQDARMLTQRISLENVNEGVVANVAEIVLAVCPEARAVTWEEQDHNVDEGIMATIESVTCPHVDAGTGLNTFEDRHTTLPVQVIYYSTALWLDGDNPAQITDAITETEDRRFILDLEKYLLEPFVTDSAGRAQLTAHGDLALAFNTVSYDLTEADTPVPVVPECLTALGEPEISLAYTDAGTLMVAVTVSAFSAWVEDLDDEMRITISDSYGRADDRTVDEVGDLVNDTANPDNHADDEAIAQYMSALWRRAAQAESAVRYAALEAAHKQLVRIITDPPTVYRQKRVTS